mmetsp:Transcript_13990/g.40981  ORF Transcript_13990/g.40981 Transcript_13990/m.40981 type:complete len:90 (+) Transcript_13990:825-1094(+)
MFLNCRPAVDPPIDKAEGGDFPVESDSFDRFPIAKDEVTADDDVASAGFRDADVTSAGADEQSSEHLSLRHASKDSGRDSDLHSFRKRS